MNEALAGIIVHIDTNNASSDISSNVTILKLRELWNSQWTFITFTNQENVSKSIRVDYCNLVLTKQKYLKYNYLKCLSSCYETTDWLSRIGLTFFGLQILGIFQNKKFFSSEQKSSVAICGVRYQECRK